MMLIILSIYLNLNPNNKTVSMALTSAFLVVLKIIEESPTMSPSFNNAMGFLLISIKTLPYFIKYKAYG